MNATIPWDAIALGFLFSCFLETEETRTEGSCLYLLPSFVENVNRSILDDVAVDAEYMYVPTNFTIILATLSFICEELMENNKELVVGESLECTPSSFVGVNSYSTSAAPGNDRMTHTSGKTRSSSDSSNTTIGETTSSRGRTNKTTTSETTSPRDGSITFTASTSPTQATHIYRISNVTYKNITDICPKSESPHYWQRGVADWIRRVYPKVIAVLGLPGNVLTLVTIVTMKPFTSTSLFIAALAVSDNCALTTKIIYFELSKRQHVLSTPICGVLVWMSMGWELFSIWLVVLVTIERFIAVLFPFRVKTLCTKRKAVITIIFTWILFVGLNSHLMWTVIYDGLHCVINPNYENTWKILIWLYALFVSIIPALMLLILNGAIVIGLRRSASFQKKMKLRTRDLEENTISQRQVTVMLVSISIASIVLTWPLAIFSILRPRWNKNNTYDYYKLLLMDSILNFLMDMNLAINFYVYFLAGKKFRGQLSNLFGCLIGRQKSRACNETVAMTVSASEN